MSLRYAITVILLLLVLALCWRAAPIWRAMVPSADWLAGWFLEKLGYTGPRLTGLSGGFAATVYDGVTFMVVMGLHVAALSVYESMVTGPLWRSFDRQLRSIRHGMRRAGPRPSGDWGSICSWRE